MTSDDLDDIKFCTRCPVFGEPAAERHRRLLLRHVEGLDAQMAGLKARLACLAEAADRVRCLWILEHSSSFPDGDMGYAIGQLETQLAALALEERDARIQPLDD